MHRRSVLRLEPLERRLVPNQFDLEPGAFARRDEAADHLLCAVNALGGPGTQGTLSYVESSTGLEPPRLEGGRTELEFGDVNGDAHVDIVGIGDHGSPRINSDQQGVMVWFGDGTGRWQVAMTGQFGYGGVALGDVNGDGLMDVGYGMHHNYSRDDFGNQLLEVALGDGTGRLWTPWDDGLATNGETYGMFETDFADVDNDGDLDIGSVSFGCCAGVHVYLNRGDGTWSQSFGFVGGNTSNNFFFGDVNGDGNADLASGSQRGTVYLGDGQGGFTPADGNLPPPPNGGRPGASLGDITRDGRADLAFVNAARGLSVWTWVSDGVWRDISGSLPATGQFAAAQIADMNLDGAGDLVAYQNGRVTVYAGDGKGGWREAAALDWPAVTTGISALRTGGDLDHNGYPDLAVIASERITQFSSRNRFRVYLESSDPSELRVYPKSPRGGETFSAGSVHFLDWHAALTANVQKHVMGIELSLTGPGGPWQPVARNVPNNGRYQWRVPADMPASDQCHLRYTLKTNVGVAVAVTPAPFTIRPA